MGIKLKKQLPVEQQNEIENEGSKIGPDNIHLSMVYKDHSIDDDDVSNTLNIQYRMDEGFKHFEIITQRWTFNTIDEMIDLLTDFKRKTHGL